MELTAKAPKIYNIVDVFAKIRGLLTTFGNGGNKMKRIFALLSAVAMALTLVACGEASGSTSSSGQSSGDTITIKLPHCYVEGHPLTDTLHWVASFYVLQRDVSLYT